MSRLQPIEVMPLRCIHNVSSGNGCWRCGDVVPYLNGQRPWWTFIWRFCYRFSKRSR